MTRAGHLPDIDRVSVLSAAILLAYASARFVEIPPRVVSTQLPGLYLEVQVDTDTIIAVLVAALTASGAHWLLHGHPATQGRRTLQHLILPGLTAWVISIPLSNLPAGPFWWAVFFVGGGILLLVLFAEYISVDPQDIRQPVATASLTAISFALFLILAISLRVEGIRLILLLPALVLAAGLVSLRSLHLRSQGRWEFPQSITIALVTGHLAAALHYWPVAPVNYGLILMGVAYSLNSMMAGISQGRALVKTLIEPGMVVVILISIGLWLG